MSAPVFLLRKSAWWWPRLLLAALVVVQVLGACGSFKFTTEDARQAPIVLRHTVDKRSFLHFFLRSYDTLRTDIVYQGRELRAACPGGTTRASWSRLRRAPGPEPRWLAQSNCGGQRAVYLIGLRAGQPELQLLGTVRYGSYMPDLVPLAEERFAYYAASDSTGTLIDWQTGRPEAVRLPALRRFRAGQPQRPAYTLAPDHRTLARLHSPDTATTVLVVGGVRTRRPGPAPALVIDYYELEKHRAHRLLLPGRYLPPAALLGAVHWEHDPAAGWRLQARP
ncbi:hypothetical protein [Hymenobacter sp. B81]|uniref:hypothetical protein n=1 Tax=Hymenobacter sp. B81 TaxID=3344878 RepID=UPI0037DC3AA3